MRVYKIMCSSTFEHTHTHKCAQTLPETSSCSAWQLVVLTLQQRLILRLWILLLFLSSCRTDTLAQMFTLRIWAWLHMRRQDRLKLDTSLFLCRSTALLSLGDGRRSLAPNPTLLTCAPYALERADARAPTLLACAPFALVRADAPPTALLACAPSALVRALCGFLLGDTVAWLRCHPSPATLPLLRRPAALLWNGWRASPVPRSTAHFPPFIASCGSTADVWYRLAWNLLLGLVGSTGGQLRYSRQRVLTLSNARRLAHSPQSLVTT